MRKKLEYPPGVQLCQRFFVCFLVRGGLVMGKKKSGSSSVRQQTPFKGRIDLIFLLGAAASRQFGFPAGEGLFFQ